MGLPEGWTKYGAKGEKISSANRYKALGNAIALRTEFMKKQGREK